MKEHRKADPWRNLKSRATFSRADQGLAMDLEKLVKFAETYLRDYVFSVLSVLTNFQTSRGASGTAEAVLVATESRTWLFAVISTALGAFAFVAGVSPSGADVKISALSPILALWLWLVFTGVAHSLVKLMRGQGRFVDTLSVCLRVLPTAYVIGGLAAMTAGLFSRLVTDDFRSVAVTVFLSVQFALLVVFLPLGLRRMHGLGALAQAALVIVLPTMVLLVNFVALVLGAAVLGAGPAMMAPPAMSI